MFVLPDDLRELYRSVGITLDRFHGETEYRLSMPARYVVDKEGIIRSADVNADYTVRPDPAETVRQLRTLARTARKRQTKPTEQLKTASAHLVKSAEAHGRRIQCHEKTVSRISGWLS